ncbi:unnamed protein product [Rotaria sp. Silwood2]|nr:unnamed protein product [Rotaria sp. Silwood2]
MPRTVDHDDKLNLNLDELPDNKEDFQLIWLDAHLAKSSDARKTKKMLRILNVNAQFYTDIDKCLEIILNIQTEHILLVVSGSLAHLILPRLQSIRSVRAVFIFCEVSELHSNLLDEYPRKIVDIYTDRDNLIKSITDTMKLIEKQDMVFRMFDCKQKSTRNLTKESASFLWNQLLVDVLRKMPTDEQAKNDMLDYCSAYYRNNRQELKKIESFRTSYTPNDAVKYYTAESFLYKLLNKALRTEDITLLYTFRLFIIDLCAQLDVGKKELIEKESEPLTLYRGQRISKEEFENLKNNIGALIATNGFISTSRDENISIEFLQSSLSYLDENMIRMQMIIKADPKTLKNVIFADVSDQSVIKLEKEVLFSLGAVFRIDECEFDETNCMGKVFLTATDEGSTTLQSYLDAQKHQLQVYSPLIYFGRLLMVEMNEVERAEEYFQMLLKTLPSDHSDIADVYNQIGATHYMKAQTLIGSGKESELSQALEVFEKALEMWQNMYGENHIRTAFSFHNIGSVYNDREEYDRALDYYERGLQIVENTQSEDSIFKANLTWNCGILKERMGDNEAALSLYLKADVIYSQYLPIHHPTHIKSASCISQSYKTMGNLREALQYYKRIFEYSEAMLLPSDKPCLDSWINVVRCCLNLNCEQEAITYLNRVLKMCERDSSCMQKTSNEYIELMAGLCEDTMRFDLALNYYKILLQSDTTKVNDFLSTESIEDSIYEKSYSKSIELLKFRLTAYTQLFPINDKQHASFLVEVGKLFNFCHSANLAYQCYQQAFNIYESTMIGIDTEDFRACWKLLIDIYFAKKDMRSMVNLLERALKKGKQFSDNGSTEIQCLEYIAKKYEANNDSHNALHYLEKVLRHAEATKSHNTIFPLLQKFLNFYQEEQEQIIEKYIQRAVDVCEKDPLELSKCHWLLYEWFRKNDMKEKALKSYEYFLLATERNDSSSTEILDKTWIDFILVDRSGGFQYGCIGESLNLFSLMPVGRQHLSSLHYKKAIIPWKSGALHETIKMTRAALELYSEATEIFEKLIYNQNDTRTKQALNYLLCQKYACDEPYKSCRWLKSAELSFLAFLSAAREDDKWKCILQRLKMLKMNHIKNQWQFHLTIYEAVLDFPLCAIVFNEMFEVCNGQMDSGESKTLLDIHSVICCFEFISHWYFAKDHLVESLRFRQYQLELESKTFNDHPHVAWSFWFMGLIFQKTKEYDLSIGYLRRALKIFERFHPQEHSDIQNLEKCISQMKDTASITDSPQTGKLLMKMTSQQQAESMPKMLQGTFHID